MLTIDDANPVAEAVAVANGRILAVGSEAAVLTTADADTRHVDLAGRTLLPGFVDSHGHAYLIGLQAISANLLPPPDGQGRDIPSLQAQLAAWIEANPDTLARLGWIIGFGYDDSQLAERRHPTRQELDAISTEHPIVIIHQSGHLGVGNSKALTLAGITVESDNPPGGVIRREDGSRQPDGVLEEAAFFNLLLPFIGGLEDAMHDSLVVAGTQFAASFGYTTVQEGRAMQQSLDAMRRVAERGELTVDLVAYPDMLAVQPIDPSRSYKKRYRVGGVKLTIDGSPQGKTAYLSEPYFHPPHGLSMDYRGYGAIDEATVMASVERTFANGWQLLCHANGDAAIDQFIDAVRTARERHPDVEVRPVLIHGQTLRRDQVDALQELAIFPSLFPMHTFYWGDWHRESVLGPTRADNISPTGWLLERGMMFGSHHDAPVALPDSMRVLSATVTRRSRSGDILGPAHRVPVATALKALTLWPAWQHFEEDAKGSIEPGKLADFAVLSANPLEVPEDELERIVVEQTIKEDRVIYRR
ncbi:putative metal-dependent hydrolase with the TIM-barrel fold protein [Pseudohaliea rubra DSM 19751]|uniref:Putative metal-dependent hydrolase with the TIM-barrel fold protein n=1 Tax=Pseudohaliea rubra DSM 19751 TaxID=1265313 RepID=A0A095X231_9GAMM|nr:putative metal-dependent hydrolase with the TIM-barrel fold protein [Pseudohaliea rubra DSM 19751]